MSDDSPVRYAVDERIATIILNRPEARNALSSEVLGLLPERLSAAEADDDVDVIVLTGTDPSFCAGLDLKELGATGGNLGGGSGAAGSRNRDGVRGACLPRKRLWVHRVRYKTSLARVMPT